MRDKINYKNLNSFLFIYDCIIGLSACNLIIKFIDQSFLLSI
jgi:hypothetical protein